MEEVADCIDTVLAVIGTPGQAGALAGGKARIIALMARYPAPTGLDAAGQSASWLLDRRAPQCRGARVSRKPETVTDLLAARERVLP